MPANLFNFSRYFKKPSDDPIASSNLDSESSSDATTMNQQTVVSTQKTAKPAAYNGIGNPSQGVSYNGIGTPSEVKPLAVNNIAVSTSSIDMGKRVGMDVLSRLTQRANKALMLAVDKTKELRQEFIDTEHH